VIVGGGVLEKDKRRFAAISAPGDTVTYLTSFENLTAFYREQRTKHLGDIPPGRMGAVLIVYDTEEPDSWLSAALKWRTNVPEESS
jgi:hypothetical protein